ncbi:MAG: winged helix-turn-helix transcriptional regulator [Spirochaetes bacterium]|nr:winged helix-turn-helix transcriptional regulator [Spirochaetota bacterium]
MNQKDDTYYNNLADIFQLFSNPIRLKIIDYLLNNCCLKDKSSCCVCEINKDVELPQPYISKHLRILKDKDIIKDEKKGNHRYYYLKITKELLDIQEFFNRLLLKYKNDDF